MQTLFAAAFCYSYLFYKANKLHITAGQSFILAAAILMVFLMNA